MKWMLASVVVLAALSVTDGALARTPSISVSEPRPFGYFIGDVIRREVLLRVGPGQQLDTASLPRPGPLNYWLELSKSDLNTRSEGDDTLYRLSLVYQTFYAPLDPRKLAIPAFKLKIKGVQGDGEVAVPELSFLMSPLRQLFSEKGDTASSATVLRPDHAPQRRPTGRERTTMLVAGILALASLAALAWHNAWWPFHRRPARPFTDAARFLRSNAQRLQDARGYRAALIKVHRAFDVAAGRRVLSDDVGDFLRQHPEFAPYAGEVEKLFASSRQAFFANEVDQARVAMPLPAITALSAQLSAAERRAA